MMNLNEYKNNIKDKQFAKQRDVMIIGALIVIVFVLSLRILMVSDRVRTVVVPASVNKTFWVDGDKVSTEYLNQMGVYIAQLMYNVTPASASNRHNLLLSYVSSDAYSALDKELARSDNVIKQTNIATYFTPTSVGASEEHQSVTIKGVFTATQGDKIVQTNQREVAISFKYDGNKLMVSSIKDVQGLQLEKSLVVNPDESTAVDPKSGKKTNQNVDDKPRAVQPAPDAASNSPK
ncbi:type IV conjugative transfer system protein TraE [Hydromonas duriensis]|uniref:Conjugal transfer pilus assembly protein TraE n=1 Tax=Hydromonas duriensis TaxID=1527608 RepID=A0A4R6Y1I2_9BURK|nr:type IV conjugative transfer system protein TraE [Hydromonas duriensis]TDR30282.1 conjugal transfer pilus assembly protein TraE [Hydromonas duriensis]